MAHHQLCESQKYLKNSPPKLPQPKPEIEKPQATKIEFVPLPKDTDLPC
jgi:hypothetical protein